MSDRRTVSGSGMRVRGRTWVASLPLVLAVVAVAVAAPGALAAKPDMVRIDRDDTFHDEFLSEECGTDVWTHIRGHIILREFDRDKGLVSLNTLSFELTAMAGDNRYSFRDVGADQVRMTKDGPIISIIGQIPFGFNGVLKINLDTDEVIHEPGHSSGDQQLAEACAALTA